MEPIVRPARQSGMRMRTPVLVLMVAIAALAGGCASKASTSAGAAPTPSPSASAGCPAKLMITATDESKTLCVQLGGTVTVTLTPGEQKPWLPIDVSGTSLTPKTDGVLSVVPGGQITMYNASAVGTSDITSARHVCPQKAGTVSCNAIVAWKVTVQVK